MSSKTEATIDDLYRAPGKAELVNGELVHMAATGLLPNYAAGEIFASLRNYRKRVRWGVAVTDNGGFIVDLPHRRSFSPDAAFTTGPLTMRFHEGAPLFAAEVRSLGDYGEKAEREIAEKRADYFAAGAQVVWDVDLLGEEVIRCYRAASPDEPLVFRRGDAAHAEPALPGWSMAVDDLFPPEEGRPESGE